LHILKNRIFFLEGLDSKLVIWPPGRRKPTGGASRRPLATPGLRDYIGAQMDWQNLETFSFGDGPELADSLLALVVSGKKRATCWAESQGLLSAEVGKSMVVLDGQGVPKAILKTVELTKRRFDQVDAAFAYDEGEGDRSLQYWRDAHTRYFSRLGRYAPDMMLWCERFELVELID
jgi:uncharacterized protein YhfF